MVYSHNVIGSDIHFSARGIDLRRSFKDAGFDCDPERDVFNQLSENALGNITWVCVLCTLVWGVYFLCSLRQFIQARS